MARSECSGGVSDYSFFAEGARGVISMFRIFMTLCTPTPALPSTCFSLSVQQKPGPDFGGDREALTCPRGGSGRLQAAGRGPANRAARLDFSPAVRVRDTQLGILQGHARPHAISGVSADTHAPACLQSALPRAPLHTSQQAEGGLWARAPQALISYQPTDSPTPPTQLSVPRCVPEVAK